MDTIPVKDEPALVREKNSQAILNTDNSALKAYRKRRDKVKQLETDINIMKEELSEIKQLLKALVQ